MKKIHYAWVMLAVCTLLFAFGVGVLINCSGIFHTAICEDTGWKYSDYIVSNLFYGIGSILALLFVSRIFRRFSMKRVIAIAVAVFTSAYACRAFMQSIFGFSVLNFIMGISGAFIVYVSIPILIKRWFVRFRGIALGISTMASGLAAAIGSPVLVSWIERFGWRKAAVLNGGISLIILMPIIILLLVDRPSDKKMTALGAEDILNENTIDAQLKEPKNNTDGAGRRAFKLWKGESNTAVKVAACVLFAFFAQLHATFYFQYTNIALDFGYGLAFGGTLVSICSIFNMVSKAAQGICMDRFGKKNTILVFITLIVLGYVALLLSSGGKIPLYFMAVSGGLAAANSTMVPALLVDTFAKGEDYVKHFSTVTYGTYIGAMLTSYVPGILREASGSYELISGIYAFFGLACIGIVVWLLRDKDWTNII